MWRTWRPYSAARRSAISDRWQASGSRSTQRRAPAPAAGARRPPSRGRRGRGSPPGSAPGRPPPARPASACPRPGCVLAVLELAQLGGRGELLAGGGIRPPRSARAEIRRRALAQAYSLPRTPRRWRTSITRATSSRRSGREERLGREAVHPDRRSTGRAAGRGGHRWGRRAPADPTPPATQIGPHGMMSRPAAKSTGKAQRWPSVSQPTSNSPPPDRARTPARSSAAVASSSRTA